MADLNFKLLKWQREVLSDQTRFKIVCAGRRCGKSRLSAVMLLIEALQTPTGSSVMYVAPTLGQARVIMWKLLHELGKDVIASSHINNLEITLVNDAVIYIRGADNPDALRGVSLTFAVLDEYAFMKKGIWEEHIRPALADKKGRALFISSPDFRNHFYDVFQLGKSGDPSYKSWHLTTLDNETIDPKEVEDARRTMSTFAFKKEFLASFDTMGTNVFKEDWIKFGEEPKQGSIFIACDLAGFQDVQNAKGDQKKLDKSAIAVVKVTDEGKWHVKKIEFGRWDVRETAVRILKNIREYRPQQIGIEKGTTFSAVMPYLSDLMRKNNIFAHIKPLSHGNESKVDRVVWALQGMFEHGRIELNSDGATARDSWQAELIDELLMFPTKGVHDDLADALSYINQLVTTNYARIDDYDSTFEPFDLISGI